MHRTYNCNLGTRGFLAQTQLEDDRATTATWALEIFRGSSNWKATESQLQSGNTRGGRSWKATGPQLQSGNSRFWWQVQLKTTMLQLQSGNSRFWWQALFEGDGAITAIWEFEGFLGMTGLLLQSENSWFSAWWLVEKRLLGEMTSIEVRSLLTLPSQCAFWTHVWELVFICEQSLSVPTCVFLVCWPANVCPRVLHYCLREVRWSGLFLGFGPLGCQYVAK